MTTESAPCGCPVTTCGVAHQDGCLLKPTPAFPSVRYAVSEEGARIAAALESIARSLELLCDLARTKAARDA